MKKVIVSILMIGYMASPAMARGKKAKQVKRADDTPAYIDHSYDGAYSERWANEAQSPAPGTKLSLKKQTVVNPDIWATNNGKNYYSLSDFTYTGSRYRQGLSQHSPYDGEDAPSYDGPAKNAYRNMRANNGGEDMPASNARIAK